MDEELRDLLRQNLEVSEKSFVILKKMRREMIWREIFRLAKWAIIIGLLAYGFVKAQPYLVYWAGVFKNIAAGIEKINSVFPR